MSMIKSHYYCESAALEKKILTMDVLMNLGRALVRTDEPFSVVLDGGPHRRLHVSQAALGGSRGRKTERSQRRNRLYCKVGENPRILLCALRFNGTEMCSLYHEFTAPDNVVFSVVGVRDIHISGYYFNEFRLPYTIMPQNQMYSYMFNVFAPLPNREEVETSGDTFLLDAPMQHVGETGGPAEESALHDGGDQQSNLVVENRRSSKNDCLGIVTQTSGQSLMNVRASGSAILASGWKEVQNLSELLMHICCFGNVSLVHYPMFGCVKRGVKSPSLLAGEPRLGERWTSDNEVNPFGNLVQENSSSRIVKKITLFELEQPSKIIENEVERFVEKCTSDDKVNRLANLVQGNSSSRHVDKITFYELEPLGNITEENESERLVDKRKIKPKKKKTTSKGLSACKDDLNALHLESVHPEKAKDRDDSQLVNEDRLKPERKKRKTDRNSMSVGLTNIRKEASEPNQQNSGVQPGKVESNQIEFGLNVVTDYTPCCLVKVVLMANNMLKTLVQNIREMNRAKDFTLLRSFKEQSHIKKDKAAKWIFKCRRVDEENLQLQTDECETTMVDYHSGEKPQLKANKKRMPETICDQDLCNQTSQLDDRNSTHHITNERGKGKLRSGVVIDEEKPETCDASDAGEIKKKKKSKTEQVVVPAADTRQEHGWRVSVEPAATQLTSTGTENSWTIVAALPAFGNPQIKSTVFICKGTLEMPPTVSSLSDTHDKGESKKKGKEKLKTQQMQVPIVETNNERSRSHSVESVETPLNSASVGNMMQKIIPGLFIQKESKKKGKRKRKTQKMEAPIVETNDESFVGSEETPEVPSSGGCQSHACDLGEVEKKKKKKMEKNIPKSKWSRINESVSFVEPEEIVELPSDLNDYGEIKKKKKMKGKKKTENIGDSDNAAGSDLYKEVAKFLELTEAEITLKYFGNALFWCC
ncbi:hypothetical protein Cgig2_027452 [Carnegiea gigantea]|uniref:peptidylprolyl isomerase n=1 Tax=Carnegiea gigantea TaxID=171969 RepID=A0A9Q1QNF4_9CARY|nr:hypothetical protein Cgig2_027452 [Carnegiea gigantea]